MADAGIKKVIIAPETLPPVNIVDDTPKHFVRYRIVSEDKSRISAWSTINQLIARDIPTVLDNVFPTINIVSTSGLVTLAWETPDILKTAQYDVYVSWHLSSGSTTPNYVYAGSVIATKNNTFSITIPTDDNYSKMYARVQVASSPKIISDSVKVSETTLTTI